MIVIDLRVQITARINASIFFLILLIFLKLICTILREIFLIYLVIYYLSD